jgi:hypothetical protein
MSVRIVVRLLAICVLLCLAAVAQANSTIIKLNLGAVGPDLGMNPAGQLSTNSDGDATTSGDQDTAIEFTGFLEPIPDINSPTASFTLSGLMAAGPAQVVGSLAIQSFASGQFNLYDPSNNLLLSAPLNGSVLTGGIGPPGTGALFTTGLSSPSGGSLAPYIAAGSLSLSVSMININGGGGLAVLPNGVLQSFLADASVLIAANPSEVVVPEPTSIALLSLGSLGLLARRRFASLFVH